MDKNIIIFFVGYNKFLQFGLYLKDIALYIANIYISMIKHTFENMLEVDVTYFYNKFSNVKFISLTDSKGNTAAHYAVAKNDKNLVKKFVTKGYYNKLECFNKYGATLLHSAVYYDAKYNNKNKKTSRVNMLDDLLRELSFDHSKVIIIGKNKYKARDLAIYYKNQTCIDILNDMYTI